MYKFGLIPNTFYWSNSSRSGNSGKQFFAVFSFNLIKAALKYNYVGVRLVVGTVINLFPSSVVFVQLTDAISMSFTLMKLFDKVHFVCLMLSIDSTVADVKLVLCSSDETVCIYAR